MVCHLVMEVFVLMRGHYLFASGIEIELGITNDIFIYDKVYLQPKQ